MTNRSPTTNERLAQLHRHGTASLQGSRPCHSTLPGMEHGLYGRQQLAVSDGVPLEDRAGDEKYAQIVREKSEDLRKFCEDYAVIFGGKKSI